MKIAVTGPQNTGKTTFISDILKECPNFRLPTITYRDLIKRKGLDINQKTSPDTQELIRNFMIDQITDAETSDMIYDRCLIDNLVYTAWMLKNKDYDSSFYYETRLMMMHHIEKYDLIFFIPYDNTIPLKPSELRDITPEYIRDINAMFIEIIIDSKFKNVVTIYGDREQRMQQFFSAVGVDKLSKIG